MTVRQLIFVTESPFSRRDEERFGIRTLLERGLDVRVWDASSVYLPRIDALQEELPVSVNPRVIQTRDDLAESANELTSSTIAMLLSGVFGSRISHRGTAFECFANTKAKLATIAAGQLAQPLRDPGISWPRSFAGTMKTKTARYSGALLSTVEQMVRRSRRLDWVWVGTTSLSIRPRLIGSQTRVRHVHSLDYDRFIEQRGQPALVRAPYLALIHALGPSHPDRKLFGIHGTASSEEYLDELRRVLRRIERISDLPVVVAAHPRTRRGILEEALAGHQVIFDASANVVQHAERVFAVNYSTAINFAVLAMRPITLLRSPILQDSPLHDEEIRLVEKLLDCQVLNVGNMTFGRPVGIVNKSAYRKYIHRYVKEPGSPEQSFWQVVASDVLSN